MYTDVIEDLHSLLSIEKTLQKLFCIILYLLWDIIVRRRQKFPHFNNDIGSIDCYALACGVSCCAEQLENIGRITRDYLDLYSKNQSLS